MILLVVRELLFVIVCLYLFMVLRSHYSKGLPLKDSFLENLHYVVIALFSPLTWYALLVAAIYVVYQIIH